MRKLTVCREHSPPPPSPFKWHHYITLLPLNQPVFAFGFEKNVELLQNPLIKERRGCDFLPVSIFVQSRQMKRWISCTVWTTAARQPPTLTTLPRKAPLAPPTLLPTRTRMHTRTRTRTHTLTRTNTLPLCQPPARTRLLSHTGPTGTHTPSPSLSSIYHHPLNVPSVLSSLPVFYSSSILSLIIKVREIHWHVQVCLSFLISAPFLFSPGFITISGLFHINWWGPSDEIVSLMVLPFSINSGALEIKNRHQN